MMKYETPEMNIFEYDMSVALTAVSPGMENWGTGEGDESDLPL